MKHNSDRIGLKPRLEAAFHLQKILGGKPFAPIGSDRLLDGRDRAFANRLVTVALRRHGQISAVLAKVLAKGMPQRAGILEAVLRIGVTQLLYLDDIPAHSALDLAVEAARADKRAGRFDKVVNGALRSVQREAQTLAALPTDLLIPDWLRARWTQSYGAHAVARMTELLVQSPPLDLTLASPDDELIAALGAQKLVGNSVRITERDSTITDLPGFAEGKWWVQDVSAGLPARVLAARPGERVLDLCAAPGGKTAQLANAGAGVTALDLSADRMARVEANLSRLRLKAELVVGDALTFAPAGKYDAILLDAPCSATGTFRRHPEVLWHRDEKGIADRVALQRDMLTHAATLLNPGGRLVYCVCSLETAEGEEQARWAQAELETLALDPIGAGEIDGWAAPINSDGTLRLTPALELPGAIGGGLDGFFVARFVKKPGMA